MGKTAKFVQKTDTVIPFEEIDLSLLKRLSSDVKKAARLLRLQEARWLCDEYYTMQNNRIRSANQVRSRLQDDNKLEPNAIVGFLAAQTEKLEQIIKGSLGIFAKEYRVGSWLQSLLGIGPVFSAYLLVTLDIAKCPYEGGFLSFAGMTPNSKWHKGEKRPWNAELKSKMWLLSETMWKFQNHEDCFYGKYFAERKKQLIQQNFEGRFADPNKPFSVAYYKDRFDEDTDAYLWYNACLTVADAEKIYAEKNSDKRMKLVKSLAKEPGSGLAMLSPGHIHRRAGRLMVTLFLSHLFNVMWRDYYSTEPPKPYPHNVLKHSDYIEVPNLDRYEFAEGRSLKDLLVKTPATQVATTEGVTATVQNETIA